MNKESLILISVCAWGECLSTASGTGTKKLKEMLNACGFTVVSLGDPRAKHSLMFEFNHRMYKKYFSKLNKDNRSLVIFEPRSVNPSNYSKRIAKRFANIWVPSNLMASNPQDEVYGGGGYYVPMADLQSWGKKVTNAEQFDVTFVNENKFSLIPGSLYSLRARAIRAIEDAGFSAGIAGRNWDKSLGWHLAKQTWHGLDALREATPLDLSLLRLPLKRKYLNNYFGVVDNPVSFYSQGKFAIIIENEPVYVTEKIFNALAAGCIPIYCGPALSSFNIPEGISIQVPPKPQAIVAAIRNAEKEGGLSILAKGAEYLQQGDPDAYWLQDSVFKRLAQVIQAKLGGESHG